MNTNDEIFYPYDNELTELGKNMSGPLDVTLINSLAEKFFPEFCQCQHEIHLDLQRKVSLVEPALQYEIDIPFESFAGIGYYDVAAIRRNFPILSERVNGQPLIWLDNAATTQKPRQVIDRLFVFYSRENSNVHRGAHTLARRTTDAYEASREKVSNFLNASSPDNIVFVRGTTEAINLVANAYAGHILGRDDEIVISWLEHHANIVPWQLVCEKTGANLKVVPVDDDGQINMNEYKKMLSPRTKIVAISHVSNVLGTITPVAEIIDLAHRYGAKVLIDGAQAIAHLKVDVQALDCDFYTFSGHKLYGPTGIGVLYAKQALLDQMCVYHGGGNMIADVSFEKTIYQKPPHKFEAGTGNIAGAIGLGEAIDFVITLGIEKIYGYERQLLEYATEALRGIQGLRLLGSTKDKASVISFIIKDIEISEIGAALDAKGIAVRAGHHCAQPILRRFGLEGSVRPSLALYNTHEEIDHLVSVLRKIVFGHQ